MQRLRNGAKVLVVFLALMGFAGTCFAQATQTINVGAQIQATSALTVTISQVVGTTWTPQTAIDFGTLVYNSALGIFLPSNGAYYAVDVGISNNNASWTVTHTTTSITDGLNSIDNNVNVTFMLQTSATTATQLSKVTYANSNNVSFTNTQLAGGWLRVYYGLATGDPLNDATGATPVTAANVNGNYAGTVTLQLTP